MATATNPLTARFAAEHFTLNSISAPRQDQVLTALARLEAFLSTPIEQASASDLRGWMVAMLNAGLAPSTVGWYLKMVKPFYAWCWRERLISADELMRLREISPPRGANHCVPRPYSREELARLWAELAARWPHAEDRFIARWRNGTSPYRRVHRHAMRLQLEAMIELALVGGLRRGEIYALSIDAVHPDNRYLVVTGKRVDQHPKLREVPYADSTREALRRWLRFRGYMGATADCLWLAVTGPQPTSALSPHRMPIILRAVGDWQLHRLRHTCATERLRAGMELEKLQRFLGHANIQQTLRYAQLVRGDVHKASARIDADFQKAIRPQAIKPTRPKRRKRAA